MENYIFTFSAIILYLASAALLYFYVKQQKQPVTDTGEISKDGRLSKKQILLIGFAGLLLHGLELNGCMISEFGINLGFFNTVSLVSAFIVLLALIAAWRHPVEILTAIFLPLAAVSILLDAGAHDSSKSYLLPPDSDGALFFHIVTSIMAYSILALAALQAVLLSIQNKFLHAHQPGGFIRMLPPLREMEVLLFEVIVVGFVALTISLGSGLIFLDNMFDQQVAHKTVLSILAWFVFLSLLIGHWKLGWRGRTAIRWTLSGFVSLMLAYFGSKFVLEFLIS
jgi:ABC-type uncharacterized transport system permease subunit